MVNLLKRAWARRPTPRQVVRVVIAVAIVVSVIRAEVHATEASDKVTALLKHQTDNRVKNVATWCSAIDGVERVLTTYVSNVPGAPPLKLSPLDCPALEQGTAASTK